MAILESLPDHLLSHILSMLPTKYAVATSLLSTKWKFLWTDISNLNFDDEQASYTYSREALEMITSKKFIQFVNRVLLQLNQPCIQNFNLKWHQQLCDPFYLHSWIYAAIGRNVQKMHLHLELFPSVELPLSHFYCKTLAVLKLNGGIHFNITASAFTCFPNLETLHLSKIKFTFAWNRFVRFPSLKELLLDSVIYGDEESVHKLFVSCPVLDNLIIERRCWDNVPCLIISIPSLKSLKTHFRCSYRLPRVHKLHIDTPALKYLYLEDSMSEYFTAENLSSLLEARVRFDFERWMATDANRYRNNIFKFIEGLFKVKFLSLSGSILKAIGSISANIAPVFCNIMRLELHRHSCRDWSVVIKNLLERMDNLEHLVMKGSIWHDSHESWWTEPLCVPVCLLRRVTTISFTAMCSICSDELELVKYFLQNAKVLELLTVHSFAISEAKFNLMQKISMIPRGSQACQVVFE